MKQTLTSIEIKKLFTNGKWITTKNVSAVYSNSDAFKYMVSAPIKNFKRATIRNKVKRLLRQGIYKTDIKNINIAFIYRGKTILNSIQIEDEIKNLLNKIK